MARKNTPKMYSLSQRAIEAIARFAKDHPEDFTVQKRVSDSAALEHIVFSFLPEKYTNMEHVELQTPTTSTAA